MVVCLADLFLLRGPPEYIRSDNGPEFTAALVRKWLADLGVQTLFIEPGSPWENGYIESFNGKLRDELLDGEIFYSLREAQVLVEMWRQHYYKDRGQVSCVQPVTDGEATTGGGVMAGSGAFGALAAEEKPSTARLRGLSTGRKAP